MTVAPLTGAWIETSPSWFQVSSFKSHPSRVRGLKLRGAVQVAPGTPSHPSRVRGLKQPHADGRAQQRHVAPLTGAWIETAM